MTTGYVTRWRCNPALAMLLLAAFAIRLASIHFGLPALLDQDELMFELGAVRMLREATLDPGWYGHPATTLMYLLAIVNAGVFLFGMLGGAFAGPAEFATTIYGDPGWVILPGRVTVALIGVLTIFLTWRLALRVADRTAAFAATMLLAVSPVHVAYSQIIRSDMMATAFLLLGLLAAADFLDTGQRRRGVAVGVWTGLATATKWPFALTVLALAGALVRMRANRCLTTSAALACLAVAGVVSLGTLFIASPYLLLNWPGVVANLQGEAQAHHLGATGGGPLANLAWYVANPFARAMGWAGLALALIGAFLPLARGRFLPVCAPVAGAFLLLLVGQSLVWERWALPLLPVLAISAGIAISGAIGAAKALRGRRMGAFASLALGLALAAPLAAATWDDGVARLNDTRTRASAWSMSHIPAGSTVLIEHFAFDLLPTSWSFRAPVGPAGCVDARALLQGKVGYRTIEKTRQGRSNVDYGSVGPAARTSCRADYAILTHFDRYAAESSLFPTEYGNYRWLLSHGTVVATFRPEPGKSGGPVVRVVRLSGPAAGASVRR